MTGAWNIDLHVINVCLNVTKKIVFSLLSHRIIFLMKNILKTLNSEHL